jgi:hypothetical protein
VRTRRNGHRRDLRVGDTRCRSAAHPSRKARSDPDLPRKSVAGRLESSGPALNHRPVPELLRYAVPSPRIDSPRPHPLNDLAGRLSSPCVIA